MPVVDAFVASAFDPSASVVVALFAFGAVGTASDADVGPSFPGSFLAQNPDLTPL